MNDEKLRAIRALRNKIVHLPTSALKECGLSDYDISNLIIDGEIQRIKRGLYRWVESSIEYSEMAEVAQIVPAGVFCLYSAFAYWELSTYIPKQHTLAVPRHMRIPSLPPYPKIKVVKYNDVRYNTGITSAQEGNSVVMVYDLEKTVCDAIVHRNRIGLDLVKEILGNYVGKPQINIKLLTEYAKKMRIYGPVKTYFEVLL
ncbi:MAG: hypothetical protein FD169_961 [Bacillota bacterium]|nr:MAG: hypothetical protein FD169_961 [Bacillota bacterium]